LSVLAKKGRKIPKFIGVMAVPETRVVTIQLLKCWADLIEEYKNIEPLFKQLEKTLPTHMFYSQAQEIAMHLGSVTDDHKDKFPVKSTSYIYVGQPKSSLGNLNCRLAGLLHRYFDEPDYKIKGKNKPMSQAEYEKMVEEMRRKERNDEPPCPEEKVPC
jgi:hypothetical protein